MNYNVHNLVRMQINGDFKLKPLDMEFEYFKTDNNIQFPDIIVNIGKFKPKNENCYLIDNEYYVKENYLYHRGKDWEVEIEGFEKGTVIINFSKHLLTNLNSPNPFSDNILLPIIQRKLLEKGYYLTHCAGIGNTLLVGHPHSFKTTIAMKLKGTFLGDDYVILKGNKMFSFPRFPKVFFYRKNNKDSEKIRLTDKMKIRFGKPIKYNICDESRIKRIVFLERVNYDYFETIPITQNEARERIIRNQELEDSFNSFEKYKKVYNSVFPIKEIKPRISTKDMKCELIMFSENNIDKVVKHLGGVQ